VFPTNASLPMTRRDILKAAGTGFGFLAFAGLATEAAAAYQDPLTPRPPHLTPRAKRVIFLCMRGGPSHLDTFDYKPQLEKAADKTASGAGKGKGKGRALLPSPWKFPRSGKSGLPISELYPYVARHADDLCIVNSMQTDVPNHPQAFLMLHTGEFRFPRPSMGSWLLYGLGSENRDLPGFVTISPPSRFGGAQNYSAGFLPAAYQGTRIGESRTPVARATIGNLKNDQLTPDAQRRQLDLIQEMNQELLHRKQVNTELEGVINSYELGFRMQRSLPGLMDLSREPGKTLQMYGVGGGRTDDFGRQCLMARRLSEAGVRFVEVCHEGWDQHNNLRARLTANCGATDQPIGALLTDLKQRGLLDDTLVVWGGEFGRTPTGQGKDGRNHNATGFSMWLAGGGVKGGIRYGETDDYGGVAVKDKVHHHDLHATILYLMGLDHQRLTYRYGGRDYSLTDIHGKVAKGIIA
jgi:Protein of unknown function (DUF1501)